LGLQIRMDLKNKCILVKYVKQSSIYCFYLLIYVNFSAFIRAGFDNEFKYTQAIFSLLLNAHILVV